MIFLCEVYSNASSEDPQYLKSIEIEVKNYSELEGEVFKKINSDESWDIFKDNKKVGNVWWTGAEAESCEY